MDDDVTTPIRLAIRKEGEFVNAYLAQSDSMEGAVLLGSIRRTILERDDSIWEKWKKLMTDAVSNAIHDQFDQRPTFEEQRAPEHERAGEA